MEKLLNNCAPYNDLVKYETKYNEEIKLEGSSTVETTFNYAFCLVHSKYNSDIEKGIKLLEELSRTHSDGRRDYIYYLAFANTRKKNYNEALLFCRAFLEIESNQQVRDLEDYVKKQIENEMAKGVAVAGGAALVIGGILGIALALLRR